MAELAGLSPRSTKLPPSDGQPESKKEHGGNVETGEVDSQKCKNNFSFATKKYLMKYGLMNERSVSFVIPDDDRMTDDDDDDDDDELRQSLSSVAKEGARKQVSRSPAKSLPSPLGRGPNMVLDIHKIQHLPNMT